MKLSDLSADAPVFRRLVAPLGECLSKNPHGRSCPSITDAEWLETGVLKVVEDQRTGRGFLQKLFHLGRRISVGNYFASLRSPRRLLHLRWVLTTLLGIIKTRRAGFDQLSCYEDLNGFDIHAGDGHFHAHASHDKKVEDANLPVEHFYSLNLRTLALNHLTMAQVGDGVKREHDMSALKREHHDTLRQGAEKGRKVLYVWDRASIGFEFWEKLKQRSGIYYITRSKKNLKFTEEETLHFDHNDPVNNGVLYDQMVKTKTDGHLVRRVIFRCPIRNETFSFLTNLPRSVRPGVIAHLYRMRWEVEKVFDEIKNRLYEKKAWSSNDNGKVAQALFICITHNLLRLLEDEIQSEGVENRQDPQRRQARLTKSIEKSKVKSDKVPLMLLTIQRVVQRSTIFIRWLRIHLTTHAPWRCALEALSGAYEAFSR